MPQEVVPQQQRIILAPYKGRLFDFSPIDDRYFIHSYVTRFFQVYGDDCIIRGLEPISWVIDDANLVTVEISGGMCIADSTCLVIEEPTGLDLNVAPYDDDGFLVVSLGYKNYHSIEENEPYLKLSYITADGLFQAPLAWRPDKDRILLACFSFRKAVVGPPPVPGELIRFDPQSSVEPIWFNIGGKQYQLAPQDNVTRVFLQRRALLAGMEVVRLTQADIQRGYLEIDENYLDREVEISAVCGPIMINAACCPQGVTPDYEVYNGRIHLRNGNYGGYQVTGLSDEFQAGDILRIEYYF